MKPQSLSLKRRWDAFVHEWVYPENANKECIKELKFVYEGMGRRKLCKKTGQNKEIWVEYKGKYYHRGCFIDALAGDKLSKEVLGE